MKNIYIILIAFLCSFSVFAQESEVTTYYLIRHAEKITTNPNDNDPDISVEGIRRAKNWINVFAETKIDAVYATDYRRTKQTAKPVADSKNLPVFKFNLEKMYDPTFKYNTIGKSVLVVGHSNSTPKLANMILGEEKYEAMKDDNFGNLYIITVTKDKVTSTVVTIN